MKFILCQYFYQSTLVPANQWLKSSVSPPLENLDKTKGNISFFFTVSDGFYYFLPSLFRAPLSINLAKNTLNAPPPFFISPLCFSGTVTLFDFSSFFLLFFFVISSYTFQMFVIFVFNERKIKFLLFLVFYFCELTSFWSGFLFTLLFKLKKLRLIFAFYRHKCLF